MYATTALRAASWLAVVAMLAAALLAPPATSADSPSGAIWTTDVSGTIVDANVGYTSKEEVYLNGGPQNCGDGGALSDGDYYFQVTDPSGATLLSSDAIKFRQLRVVNGVVNGVSGSGNHAMGDSTCNGGRGVRLSPFADSPNSGSEYSVDIAPVADVSKCDDFNADLGFNFKGCTSTKNDNFKVDPSASPTPSEAQSEPPSVSPSATPSEPPSEPPSEQPSATPSESPSEQPATSPEGSVEAVTGHPDATPPPTDSMSGVATGQVDAWRLVLIGLAGILAAVLLLTSASTRRITGR